MPKRNKAIVAPSNFSTVPYMEVGGFAVNAGDTIKISGEYGTKFKFIGVTTNELTGATWADCFEIFRGKAQQFRAFRLERVKRIPQKGKRAKRVDN